MPTPADLAPLLWRDDVVLRRVSSGPADRYNTSTEVLGDPEPVPAYFEVTQADESAGTDRERNEEALLVIGPDTQPRARDIFEVAGERWLVSGEPRTFDALPAGADHHTEVRLIRVREGP